MDETDGMNSSTINTTSIPIVVSHNQRVVVGVIFLIISIIGTLGNGLIIFAVFASRKLQTFTNIFVVNLSVADLLICLMVPWQCVVMFSPDGSLPISRWACGVIGATIFICVGCSLYTLAAIGTYRLILLTDLSKDKRPRLHTAYFAIALIASTWIIPILVNIVPHVIGAGRFGFNEKYHTCGAETSHPRHHELETAQTVGMYAAPFIVIVGSYVLIFVHIRNYTEGVIRHNSFRLNAQMEKGSNGRSKASIARSDATSRFLRHRQITITKNMFYVVLAFILCLTPYAVCLVLPQLNGQLYAAPFVTLNSCINPFLYGFKHPHFNEVFKTLLKTRCRQVPEQSPGFRVMRRSFTSDT